MNRILRVVGGPLKGAEIALVAGTKVKVGSGDDCDVLVADSQLAKFAFELDVAEDEVTIITPDGAAKTMLDFEAKAFGSSAFAVGPAEGAWQEIVWPEKKGEESGATSEEGLAGEIPPKAEPLKERGKDARPEAEDGEGPSRVSRHMSLVLAVAAVVLVLIALLCLKCCRSCREGVSGTVASCATLAAVAERYGLSVVETNGQSVIRGDLKCRSERLAATAEAFQAQPGVEVDLSDDESLLEASEALIAMVAGNSLKVVGATNRVVVLRGNVASLETLRDILEALDQDVPCVAKVDCAQVVCDAKPVAEPIVAVKDLKPAVEKPDEPEIRPVVSDSGRTEEPVRVRAGGNGKPSRLRLPLCGILTVPYPCIILKDGARVSEGGEFGGYVVEKISADALTLRNGKKTFEWRP